MSLARPRRRRGCLGALGYAFIGAVACLIVGIVLSLPHGGRVRQWHPYGPKGPVVTAYHQYTWGHAISPEPLLSFGYDRYTFTAGDDPTGSYGAEVPMAPDFGPPDDDLSAVKVTGDDTGITVTYHGKSRGFVPKSSLELR